MSKKQDGHKNHHHHHHHHHKNEEDDLLKEPRWSPRGIMAMATMFPLAVGPGTAQSAAEKLKVLKIAAGRDKGKSCGKAWYRLGKAHLEGEGTSKDRRQALHCFEMSAERHNVSGALEAGKLFFEGGPGFKVNKERARYYFKLAAEGGVPDAQRRLGELNLASPDKSHSETLQFFLDAFTSNPIVNASAGMAAARMLTACMASPEPDYYQAVKLLEKAADAGSHGPARLRLAVMYELGSGGVEKDPAKARAYWKLAIVSDVPEAHYRVAILALHGAGFVKSERAAVNGYRRAAKLGFIPQAADKLVELRGEKALKDINAHRNPPPDFVDIKFHQKLYPYPYYDDEKEKEARNSEEAEENYKQERNAKKEALVKAMMMGGQRAVDRLNKEYDDAQNKEKAFKAAANWTLPISLVKHLEMERRELMACIDTYEHHMPTRYEPPPPPSEDRVRSFYKNMGVGGFGSLATIPLKDALVGLNGEGLGEYAHGSGREGHRNAIFEEQQLDKKLGLLRKTAKIMSPKPTGKGHANLLEVESRMFSANSRPHSMFLSASAKEHERLKQGRAKTAAVEKQKELDATAVIEIAKGSTSKQVIGNRRIANMLAASKEEAQGGRVNDQTFEKDSDVESPFSFGTKGDKGGNVRMNHQAAFTPYATTSHSQGLGATFSRSNSIGAGSEYSAEGRGLTSQSDNNYRVDTASAYTPRVRGRASTAVSTKRKVNKKTEEVPAWMNDSVWMAQPKTDASLFRAVELRRNYGATPRLHTASSSTRDTKSKERGGRGNEKEGNKKLSQLKRGGQGSITGSSRSSYGSKTEGAYSEYGASSVYSSSYKSSINTSRSGY